MQVESLGELPYCKGLWLVISGTTSRCERALVVDEIKNATDLLKNGINYFKKFTESSLQKFEKTNPRPKMFDLISKLSPLLNLDATIAWELTLNYMVYEYRSCAETFASQLADLTSVKILLEELWSFYYCERITMLKCLKLMIEYRDNENHPYKKEFAKFFEENPLKNLLQSVLDQIERLKFTSAASRSHLITDEHLHKLYNSNLIEMRELLQIATVILDTVRPDNFDEIYNSVCGEPRRLSSSKSHEDKEIIARKLEEIRKCQASLYIVILDIKKHSDLVNDPNAVETWIGGIRRTMQDTLEHKCLRDSSPEDGPLLLAWMLANYAVEPENSETLNQFRPFGVRAVHLDVFRYLQNLVDSEVIKEETRYAQIVRGSVYNLLSLLCSFIDEDKLSTFDGIFEAVASTLRCPELAADFWKDKDQEGGLWPYYHRAAALFPYRFEPLTFVATGLAGASASSAQKISAKLEELTTLTLQVPRFRGNVMSRTASRFGTAYRPYESDCVLHRNNFAIPEESEKIVLDSDMSDTEIVLFKVTARYGDAFHHKIEQLFGHAGGGLMNVSDLQTNLLENIAQGFALLSALLAANLDIPPGMVIPTELSLEIVNRFSYPVLPRNLYKIVASCLQVTSKLALKYPEEIFTRMRIGVYPRFSNGYQEVTELARASSFDGGLIASWLSGIETIQHQYPILNAYLDTLSNYLIAKHSTEVMDNVEIPGMVFLLQGVLPKLDSWYFTSEAERIDLWFKSMFCIHRVLDANLSKNEPRKKLQLVVAYSLLYLEPRHALLKLIRTGERNLRNKMMTETDWISGKGFKIIKSVQLALSLVNRLLMFRKSLGLSHDERSPLEVALYTSPSLPNALLIVPTIVNYLYVEFSPALQVMAVRLLKKFAHGFSMSLLVCMGMDGTAIRGTFASRLMSPTCSVEVKVAILELVAVCLERQPGLTEALFNIMHQAEQKRIFPRPADQFLTEGCSQFLDLYLRRIASEKEIVCDRLYENTMSLLRAMWYNRNVILVNYFRKRENFWTQIFSPLFNPLIKGSRGYAYLIDIVTLELFESSPPSSPEDDFTKNLEKLLHKDRHWELIIDYILTNIPQGSSDQGRPEPDETSGSVEAPLYEANIEAWYHFIVTLTDARISSELLERIEPAQIQFMMKLTLTSLSTRIKNTSDIADARITMLLTSLALRCVFTWKAKCIDNPAEFVANMVQLMEDIFHSYSTFGVPLRRILISLLLGCVQLVKDALAEDRASLEYLLVHSCLLSTTELRKLAEAAKKTKDSKIVKPDELNRDNVSDAKPQPLTKSYHECTPATLTVSMVTQLLRCNPHKRRTPKFAGRSTCLHLRQMIPELMNCLHETLQIHKYVGFSRAALEFLGTIARSPFYNPPPRPIDNDEAIAKLWLDLVPPTSLGSSMLESLYDDRPNLGQWRCQDWWQIYTLGLEFLTSLVANGSSPDPPGSPPTNITPIILFLGSHEYQLTEVATLLRHTADPMAIDLVQSLVALISALTTQQTVWESIQLGVREGLMKCMYLIYDSTVNLLLRPRILKFIIDGVSVESAEDLHFCDEKLPSNELKLLVNKLIVVNWWCAQCFVRFSPRLNALVDTIYTQDFWHTPLAEMNFGPPQMSLSSGPSLTYGTIISSTQLFIQALNSQLSAGSSSICQTPSKDSIDSAKREWERATPENPRKLHAKDLRILNPQLSGYLTGPEVLGHPRLLRRPYDPLICENTILSRATSFAAHHSGRLSKSDAQGSQNQTAGQLTPSGKGERADANPWFASMNGSNSRLALEVNLVLVLCQTLEGVKSPRLALRDRQLIARETANEIGVFFDFLDQRASALSEWDIEGALVGVGANDSSVRSVKPPVKDSTVPPSARLREGSTINRVPVGTIDHDPAEATSREAISLRLETRLDDEVVTTGSFEMTTTGVRFLSLIGKLFKSMVESLDSAQYG